jgi:hypothetical protein
MTEEEARLSLQSYRPGLDGPNDPQFAGALRMLDENRELARWWEEEQAFDKAIATHVAALPEPFGLKTRILARAAAPQRFRFARWMVGLAGAAAVLFLLAQVADVWRNTKVASVALPDYADEMVSFVKMPPPLELMSSDLSAIEHFVSTKDAIVPADMPPRLAALDPVGCRILSFRGHDVTLICFKRDNGGLAHLFTVDRSVLPQVKPGDPVAFERAGEWMTATWSEKDRVYMIAVEGDEATARRFLPDA